MNRYDFTQPGGLPFDQGVLAFIQDCISTAAKTASLAGPRAILSGCLITGGSVTPGMVVIDGEILPFAGGTIQDKIIIEEIVTDLTYQDNQQRPAKYQRTAKFGDDGSTTIKWVDFKRNTTEGILARLDRLEWLSAPDLVDGGGMRLWRKPSTEPLPAGWQEVVDWQGRLLQGRDAGQEPGVNVGSDTFSISANNIPKPPGLVTSFDGPRPKPADGGGNTIYYPTAISGGQSAPSPNIDNKPKARTIMFIEPIPNYIQ